MQTWKEGDEIVEKPENKIARERERERERETETESGREGGRDTREELIRCSLSVSLPEWLRGWT